MLCVLILEDFFLLKCKCAIFKMLYICKVVYLGKKKLAGTNCVKRKRVKKSRIRETLNILTDADSSTKNIIIFWPVNNSFFGGCPKKDWVGGSIYLFIIILFIFWRSKKIFGGGQTFFWGGDQIFFL